MLHLRSLAALALATASVAGCSSSDSSPAAPPTSGVAPGCDPLVPTYCGYPFPSSTALVDDPKTVTGKRVAFTKAMLPRWNHKDTDPAPWSDSDGFSAGQSALTHIVGATIAGLPTQDTIETSLGDGSPTVLLEADTGKRVAHFAELDMSTTNDDERTFILRPVVRLKDATRYIVAIRRVVDAGGNAIAPTPAFQALRDGTPFGDDVIEQRRPLYADIFAKLKAAGIDQGDLQIAWDYTTASRENDTRWMLKMRDEALATVGAEGPAYTIDANGIEDNPNPHIRRRIHGHMTVPLYLDKGEPKGTLVFGEDGMPRQNGTYDYPFVVHIPNSAVDGAPGYVGPGVLLQNGHGLLGGMDEGEDGYLAEIADSKNMVAFGVDLVGMAGDDIAAVTDALTWDIGTFKPVVGRQHQGLLNSLLAMRMMKGRFWKDPAVQWNGKSAIDPSACYYRGDSQGGIFGTTYMAISTDVTRGLVSEPGAPYDYILSRSADFNGFWALLRPIYQQAFDIQMLLGAVQMLWDRTEPDGYLAYIHDDPLPGTPPHDVLIHAAIGDHQVTPLSAHFIARGVGAKNLAPVNRTLWGIDEVQAPHAGSTLVEWSFGLPESPKTNTAPKQGRDPHEWVRNLPEAQTQADEFFRTGIVNQTCGGPCVFPEPP